MGRGFGAETDYGGARRGGAGRDNDGTKRGGIQLNPRNFPEFEFY